MSSRRSNTVDIVMLGSFGIWTRGTLQSRALPLARALARSSGLRLAIITTPWDDPEQAGVVDDVDGVRIINTRRTQPSLFPLAVAEQLRHIQKLNPSLVHVMKPKAHAGLTAMALCAGGSRPRILVDYDDWEGDGGWNDHAGYPLAARRLFSRQERTLLQSADAVTAASTLLTERAIRLRRELADPNVTFLPNGLDNNWRERLTQRADRRTCDEQLHLVLYSRFAEFSIPWLNAMLKTLDGLIAEPIALDIIGREPASSAELGPFNAIHLCRHGHVERDRIPNLLANTAIALYPYTDNLINRSKQSVKLLELMAAGCAIVGSDVGDIRRIGGDTVLAIQSGDPAAFAQAVHGLVIDRHQTAGLGKLASERAREFTIDKLAGKLQRAYRNCGLR